MKPFLAGSGRWSGKVACVDLGGCTRAPLALPEPAGGFLGLSGRLPEDAFFLKAALAPHPGRSEHRPGRLPDFHSELGRGLTQSHAGARGNDPDDLEKSLQELQGILAEQDRLELWLNLLHANRPIHHVVGSHRRRTNYRRTARQTCSNLLPAEKGQKAPLLIAISYGNTSAADLPRSS
jgi:hypothetical protein